MQLVYMNSIPFYRPTTIRVEILSAKLGRMEVRYQLEEHFKSRTLEQTSFWTALVSIQTNCILLRQMCLEFCANLGITHFLKFDLTLWESSTYQDVYHCFRVFNALIRYSNITLAHNLTQTNIIFASISVKYIIFGPFTTYNYSLHDFRN